MNSVFSIFGPATLDVQLAEPIKALPEIINIDIDHLSHANTRTPGMYSQLPVVTHSVGFGFAAGNFAVRSIYLSDLLPPPATPRIPLPPHA